MNIGGFMNGARGASLVGVEASRTTRTVIVIFMVLAAGVISGCYAKARDEARAAVVRLEQEKTGVNADLQRQREAVATAQRQVTELTERVRAVEAQNQQLRQTPRFYFDRAVDAETQATTANTDAADRTAIAAFHEVSTRFPEDPLAGTATAREATLEGRIADRASALRAAQASVVRLIATCRRETATASAAERGSIRFDGYQQLDMNTAMAGSRRAEGHTRAATAAKEHATGLLAGVPDPGNTLRDQINGCDESSD
ncbi:MAG: hypothetical protein IPF99_43695 [Deltaproteobacteria bacterium]|nr:hypothetical protein [Deltaproteobacteria bacterium]